MPFTIVADLPLGTYRGARADGGVESVPSVARLYSALICAAGLGPRAVRASDDPGLPWRPCEADEAALRWLEVHPPDRVSIPRMEVNTGAGIAYRNDGTVRSVRGTMTFNRTQKSPDVSVAVDGPFSWTWLDDPPPHVALALDALCLDVPHLGTTESPVRLSTSSQESGGTHVLDPDAGLFNGAGGEDVELPAPGRFDELLGAYASAQGPVPSLRQDKQGSVETSGAPAPPRASLRLARYVPRHGDTADVPWPDVLLLPLDKPVPERERVRLALAAHRALIATIGDGAPSLITGTYPDGVLRPANRLAIQVIDASMSLARTHEGPALAILVPRDAEPADLEVLSAALPALTSLRSGANKRYRITQPATAVSGATFWQEPDEGMLRLWRTAVPAVPDTRGIRSRHWTFSHAALLSLAYVWKDRLGTVPGRGDERQLALVDAANAAGALVLSSRPVHESDVSPWVHKVHGHAVVRPYRTEMWTGDLGPSGAVLAIGQTRHLGGGLLVPHDVPRSEG